MNIYKQKPDDDVDDDGDNDDDDDDDDDEKVVTNENWQYLGFGASSILLFSVIITCYAIYCLLVWNLQNLWKQKSSFLNFFVSFFFSENILDLRYWNCNVIVLIYLIKSNQTF